MMLHTKYRGSMSCGFSVRREDFFMFPYKTYVKHVPPRRGHFWPKGHKLNKLCSGILGDDTYQISRLYVLRFQTGRFLKFSSRKSIF